MGSGPGDETCTGGQDDFTKLVMANEDLHRIGVHVGSGMGGFDVIELDEIVEAQRLME